MNENNNTGIDNKIESIIEYTIINNITKFAGISYGNISHDILYVLFNQLDSIISTNPEYKAYIEKKIISIVQQQKMDDHNLIYLVSFLLYEYKRDVYLQLILEATISSNELSFEQKMFVLSQMKCIRFANTELQTPENNQLFEFLFDELTKEAVESLQISHKFEKTGSKKVVIMASQLLD